MRRGIARHVVVPLVAFAVAAAGVAATSGVAWASQSAEVIAVAYRGGAPTVDAVVGVPNNVDAAARRAGKDYGLCFTVSYVSSNQTLETLQSGRLSIASLASNPLGAQQQDLKGMTAETVQVPLGSTPPPGGSPNYNAFAVILDPTEPTCP